MSLLEVEIADATIVEHAYAIWAIVLSLSFFVRSGHSSLSLSSKTMSTSISATSSSSLRKNERKPLPIWRKSSSVRSGSSF